MIGSYTTQYIVNLTKIIELNNLTQENVLNLTQMYCLHAYVNKKNAYINIFNILFWNCSQNRLIYVTTHMEVKNNKILFNSHC